MLAYNYALVASLIIVVFLAAYVLVKSDSAKKVWYLALLASVVFFLLGELLGKLSTTAEGAFIGTKVEYIGSSSLTPAIFLFVADYCAVKLRAWLKTALWVIPIAVIVLLWTTESHGLIYSGIDFAQATGVQRLRITPGPLHLVIHIYSLLMALLALVLLVHRFYIGSWGAVRRLNILMLIFSILLPVGANVLYFLKIISLNVTPILLAPSAVLLFFNTIRLNLLDILPLASRLALQSIKEALVLVDAQNNFIHANKAGQKLFPQLTVLRIGQPMREVEDWLFADIDKIDPSVPVPFEMPDDAHYIANISLISERKNSSLLGYIILIQDMTESVQLNKKLEEMAHTDALTGILNRRQFMNLADNELERVKRSGASSYFVLFDIDHFKKVNDTHGHLVGDRVLKCLTERVKAVIRPYDIFARYGGEEFILYIGDISEQSILNHTERIRLMICETPMEFSDLGISLTVSSSFGVAPVTATGTLDSIINKADEALYKAKTDGRNRIVLAK